MYPRHLGSGVYSAEPSATAEPTPLTSKSAPEIRHEVHSMSLFGMIIIIIGAILIVIGFAFFITDWYVRRRHAHARRPPPAIAPVQRPLEPYVFDDPELQPPKKSAGIETIRASKYT